MRYFSTGTVLYNKIWSFPGTKSLKNLLYSVQCPESAFLTISGSGMGGGGYRNKSYVLLHHHRKKFILKYGWTRYQYGFCGISGQPDIFLILMPDTRNPALLTTAHLRFPIQYCTYIRFLVYVKKTLPHIWPEIHPCRYPDIRLVISGVRLDQLDTGFKKKVRYNSSRTAGVFLNLKQLPSFCV